MKRAVAVTVRGHNPRLLFVLCLMLMAAALAGCAGGPTLPPIKNAEYVDIDRFMGNWYVIANIPTFLEKDVYNATESYERVEKDVIATTFSFNKGGFDGERKTYTPTGFISDDPSNALWGMRFVWPIKADYRVVYVDDDYQHTIIGRNKRDYVWIMARTPSIPESDYRALVSKVADMGYETTKLEKVPQRW